MKKLSIKIAILISVAALIFTGCSNPFAKNKSYTGAVFAMDTYMELTAYGANAEEAVDAATIEINRLDDLLSTGSKASEISRLNASGSADLSEDSISLLTEGIRLWNDTDNAFDIAIYPVMQLWGFDTKDYRVPSDDEIENALAVADPDMIEIDGDRVTFEGEGMEVDLGGIAKGYTSDRVMELFKEQGVESAIISLGRNVQTLGLKPDGSKWKIGILNPDDEESMLGTVAVENKAVITSGGYERYFEENGKTYHHIIAPATGYPAASGLKSVTIVSENGTLADGLSTSMYIMGLDKASIYWQTHSEDFDMILYTDDGQIYITAGIAKDFSSDMTYEIIEND